MVVCSSLAAGEGKKLRLDERTDHADDLQAALQAAAAGTAALMTSSVQLARRYAEAEETLATWKVLEVLGMARSRSCNST